MIQRTLSILKPDITRRNLTGRVNALIEDSGLKIIAQKRIQLTLNQAKLFYSVHKERSFFEDFCASMITGPIIVQVLEGVNAIDHYRQIMGVTNPIHAADGTIRKLFAESIESNSVHGSDAVETAVCEISFFFSQIEIVS